jgi:enoyl-CoA hydratase
MPVSKTLDENGIQTVIISRPEALNALNAEVMDELIQTIAQVYDRPEIRAVVITGDGEKGFVAGADIRELSVLDQQLAYDLSKKGQKLFSDIENCSKPVLAAVNGFALGGGCELAMACHFRFATTNAKFGQPEISLGIIPGYGGTQRLTQLVGRGKALELLLSGEMVTAEEARNLGLVNHVFATREEMMAKATDLLRKIVAKSALTIAHMIRVVNAGFAFEKAGYEAEAQAFASCADTEDFKEGTLAFLEKRKPIFKGN